MALDNRFYLLRIRMSDCQEMQNLLWQHLQQQHQQQQQQPTTIMRIKPFSRKKRPCRSSIGLERMTIVKFVMLTSSSCAWEEKVLLVGLFKTILNVAKADVVERIQIRPWFLEIALVGILKLPTLKYMDCNHCSVLWAHPTRRAGRPDRGYRFEDDVLEMARQLQCISRLSAVSLLSYGCKAFLYSWKPVIEAITINRKLNIYENRDYKRYYSLHFKVKAKRPEIACLKKFYKSIVLKTLGIAADLLVVVGAATLI